MPAKEVVVVSGLVGDEDDLLSASFENGASCSALWRPVVCAHATGASSRGDGTSTEQPTLLTRSSVSHSRPLEV